MMNHLIKTSFKENSIFGYKSPIYIIHDIFKGERGCKRYFSGEGCKSKEN